MHVSLKLLLNKFKIIKSKMGAQQSCCDEKIDQGEIKEVKILTNFSKKIHKSDNIELKQYHNLPENQHASIKRFQYDQKITENKLSNELTARVSYQQQSDILTKIQNEQSLKNRSKVQIEFKYPLIVNQLIQKLSNLLINEEPFERQFSEVDKQTIKVLKVNNEKDLYKGQIDYFQRPHGLGILIKSNGHVLFGNFLDGKAHGNVFYILNNGSYYKGKMVQNQIQDTQGEFHSNKLTYVGNFTQNHFHGQGTQLTDQYFFKGQYQKGLKKFGILRWDSLSNNNQKPQNNELIPRLEYFSGIREFRFLYEGYFDQNQKFTGKGRLKDQQGQYFGNFLSGLKNGYGQYRYENRLKYVGEYRNGKKQGFGKLFNSDDTLAYEGNWKDDLPEGKGCSYDFKGNKHQSEFIRGISKIIAPN